MYITKHYYPHIAIFVPILFIVVFIIILVKKKDGVNIEIPKTVAWIFIIVGSVATFLSLDNYISLYKNVYLEYKNGNYLECEGTVEELDLMPKGGNGPDRFTVNGVDFELGGVVFPGYQKQAVDGGFIDKEGMYVRIRYCTYFNQNYIMEVHIE